MACYEPNAQQMPRSREFRKLFATSTGNTLIITDYSQIELRIAAELAEDERMTEAYRNKEDLHALIYSDLSCISWVDVLAYVLRGALREG